MSTPELVVVPGLGLDARSWRSVDCRVRPLPAYGERARPGVDLAPGVLADRVRAALAELDDQVVLAGHSSGCQIAAHVAASQPDRVAGLVLVGATLDPGLVPWPRLAAAWLRTARREDPRQVPSLVRQYARTGLGSMARGIAAARLDLVQPVLAAYGGPVLLLRGCHDAICDEAWLAHLASLTPRGVAETLPAGGHMVPLTHGPLVGAAVGRFRGRLG